MLDPDRINLDELCQALEDHSDLTSWWLDPTTGALHMFGDGMWDGRAVEEDFEPPAGMRRIEPLESGRSYADLADFTGMVRDPKARERLERATERDAAVAVFPNPRKARNALQVDDVFGQQSFLFEGDDQVSAACKKATAGAVVFEQPARFLQRRRLIKFEWFSAFHRKNRRERRFMNRPYDRRPFFGCVRY